jgi:hypothetical protein
VILLILSPPFLNYFTSLLHVISARPSLTPCIILQPSNLLPPLPMEHLIPLFFFLGGGWGLNSGLCACKVGTLPLEPQLQSILLCLFWRWGLSNYLPGVAMNCDSPDLSLPNGLDYRCEPLMPVFFFFLIYF